jgi:hypothetical protein
MAQLSQIAQLEERQRLLVAESDQLRQQMASELAELSTAATWVESGYSLVQSLRSLWPVLAGAAGLFVARKRGGWLQTLGKAWSLWGLAKRVAVLWRRYSAAAPSAEEATPN